MYALTTTRGYGMPHNMETGIHKKFILSHFLNLISYYPISHAAATKSDYMLSADDYCRG
jgi:hypothetical protein